MDWYKLMILFSCFYLQHGSELHHREKRFLVFPFGGTYKMVFSFAIPVKFAPKMEMGIGWNFQYQIVQARNATQYHSYPPIVNRALRRKRESEILENDLENNSDNGYLNGGSDRAEFYKLVEHMLDEKGISGRTCLLRVICENAGSSMSHEDNGLYGQVLDLLLTPNYGDSPLDPDLDIAYSDAQRAGEFGVECDTLYTDCDIADGGLFDLFSILNKSFY